MLGNSPISNSKASTSTFVIFFSKHSSITASTKRRDTGRLIGPMATSRADFLPWKVLKPSIGSALYAERMRHKILFLLYYLLSFLFFAQVLIYADIVLAFILTKVDNLKGAVILAGLLELALYTNHAFARSVY